jgi:hypothetical protein
MVKTYWRVAVKCRNFCAALGYDFPVHINILECRCGKCYAVIFKKYPIRIISQKYFSLFAGKMANAVAHQRIILETQKPVAVLI